MSVLVETLLQQYHQLIDTFETTIEPYTNSSTLWQRGFAEPRQAIASWMFVQFKDCSYADHQNATHLEMERQWLFPSQRAIYGFALWALAFFILRPMLDRFLYRPIAEWWLRAREPKKPSKAASKSPSSSSKQTKSSSPSPSPKKSDPIPVQKQHKKENDNTKVADEKSPAEILEAKKIKFRDCLWRLCFYTSIFFFGLAVCIRESFFYDRHEFMRGWPYHALDRSMDLYYMIAFAYYSSSLVYHFVEIRKKDFLEMLIHHIATCILLVLSYSFRFYRFGCMTMLIHDGNDILLELGKLMVYLNREKLADIVFAAFAGSWFVTRFFLFAYVIILPATFFPFIYLYVKFPVLWFIIIFCLHTLLVLHAYWGWLIAKIAIRSFRGKGIDDIRENDDDE